MRMRLVFLTTVVLLLSLPVFAQTAAVRGQVTDQSGAVVPGATIKLSGADHLARTTAVGSNGSYSFTELAPGDYEIEASAPNLALKEPVSISLKPGFQALDLVLDVVATRQQVNVEDNAEAAISTDATTNANATAITGKDLDALSDNADDLASDLQALAGPAAGPNGGSIYIDGFSGGELPPKNAIREVRINQNPFSPEYDKLGFGRIEIFTKPGSDKFRASVGYNFAFDKWNSRNPYAAEKAPFLLNESRSTFSGPLGKRASFTLDFVREWVDNGSVVNGVTLDPTTLVPSALTATETAYLRRTGVTPRIDYQLSKNNTLSVRYGYRRDDVQNAGIGGLNLASRGYHNDYRSETVQVTETAVLNNSTINETRLQYYRPTTIAQANTAGYALQVLDAFNGGSAPMGNRTDTRNYYELQNYTSMVHHSHTFKYGVRMQSSSVVNVSPQNFQGTFTFGGGMAPELDANNQPILDTSGQPVMTDITSIESYRRTLLFQELGHSPSQIRQLGGGATQFTIGTGDPRISASQIEFGAFVGDDWKLRSNLTLSLGLRYETQSNIHDWSDVAPRIGLAWAPSGGSSPKAVVRAGFGIFYDRFSLSNTLNALRYNGVVQQQYVITNPDFFPTVPAISSLTGPVTSSIQKVSPNLRAPYLMQSAISIERQLPLKTTLAITYANTHGLHQLRSENVNAPLPGSYDPDIPGSGISPLGTPGQVLVMESSGLYNQNQVIVNVNSKVNRSISLNASYTFNRAMSNTDGLGSFPADPYSMAGEYGPAATDVHHRVSLAGTITAMWGITFNPLLTVNSGPPFDITAGRDIWGDGLFSGRPGIATDPTRPGVISTRYGLLDPNPLAGEKLLSRNYGRGPGQIMLNMRVGRTFAFGRSKGSAVSSGRAGAPAGTGGGHSDSSANPFSTPQAGPSMASSPATRRYNLTVSMQIRNFLNHNNPGPIIGNITSPLFGLANQLAGVGGIFSESANNRRLELQTRFTF
jgi:hypothetical protein